MGDPFEVRGNCMRRLALIGFWLGALGACTPLGFWVYDDPAFEVSRVRLDMEQATDSTVLVALYVWNPNDYDLSTTRLELRLQLDGKTVGHFRRDSIIPVPPSATATLSLPFIPASNTTGGQLAAFRTGTHRFEVEGQAVFQTPFGDRRVRVAHAGDMAFGTSEPVSGSSGSETRPGLPMPNRWPAVWRNPYPRPTR
jgi:LEA14-like dessication related protein